MYAHIILFIFSERGAGTLEWYDVDKLKLNVYLKKKEKREIHEALLMRQL